MKCMNYSEARRLTYPVDSGSLSGNRTIFTNGLVNSEEAIFTVTTRTYPS